MHSTTIQEAARKKRGVLHSVTDDLAYMRTAIVNVYFFGEPGAGDRRWVLIDTGIYGYTHRTKEAAARRFGRKARPNAIILTHGHFDHVGNVRELCQIWDVPVYAHALELPYLTGRSPYPPPDPAVGGGMMAALSWSYPRGPIDLGHYVRALPEDGSVPGMPEWRWIHTPGHTPGHVSLFRDRDRTLIAGDAFVTVKQESALAVLMQRPEIHGPPAYYTPDWEAAHRSVEMLAALEPEVAATGHGVPLRGQRMREGLQRLAHNFARLALPARGRYLDRPAIADERGVVFIPPAKFNPRRAALVGLGAALLGGLLIAQRSQRTQRKSRRRP